MTNTTERRVLEGVPRIHFYEGGPRCPEDVPFPSAVRAYMEYIGDDLGCKHTKSPASISGCDCAYANITGISGSAFFLSWGRGWQTDNAALHFMSDDPGAPYERTFKALGYDFDWIRKDEAEMRRYIVESIGRGRPVIAFGVVGPPEPSLIAGYDEGGDVLVGWSVFQGMPEFNVGVEFEPSGHFRKRNWFESTECIARIGEKRERPALDETYRDALRWGLQVARTPVTYGTRPNGLAAYDAWAADVLRDEDLATDDMAVLMERYMAHFIVVGMVAECRWYGSLFLNQVARRIPEMADDLAKAAECFVAEHDLMWAVWEFAGGNGVSEVHARKFAEPITRQRISPLIRLSRKLDAEAADHIERALSR